MNDKDLLKYLKVRKNEFEKEFVEIRDNDKQHPKYSKRERMLCLTGAISAIDIIIKDVANNDIGIENLIKN